MGKNIAEEIIEILKSYDIRDKIGYFILDNATNNNTTMVAIAKHFNLPGKGLPHRVHYISHIINLIIKALLFSTSYKAFKDKLPRVQALNIASYNLWLKQGPVGKLYNLVT